MEISFCRKDETLEQDQDKNVLRKHQIGLHRSHKEPHPTRIEGKTGQCEKKRKDASHTQQADVQVRFQQIFVD